MIKAIAWIWKEFKEMVPAMAFFLVTFHMILITKVVILESYQLSFVKASSATLAALIVAKAILIVDTLSISNLFANVAWHNILWRALLFYLVTAFFHILESLISHYREYGSLPFDGSALTEWISWPHFLILQMWLVALILLYTGLRELSHLIGRKPLIQLLTSPRPIKKEA